MIRQQEPHLIINMDIKHLTSGSQGNAILLTSKENTLLLDGGVSVSQLIKRYGVSISRLDGVLITHEHMDHAKAIEELLYRQAKVYTSKGTAEALSKKMNVRGIHILKEAVTYKIGGFTVVPVKARHDAREPFAFYIASGDSRVLYCTDSKKIPNSLKGITHYIVECNYDEQILEKTNRPEYTKTRIK